ncbi:MAG: Hsp20/alpha crystallin family protein [Desulfobulbaceae bacterium]|nr:Hsp20/alpha crystallin family protein [Desulfobulbaceae bacterium]
MIEKANITTKKESLPERSHELPSIIPVVDIYENEDEILLHADMPGVAKEDITVNIDNGKLDIFGVRNMKTSGVASWEEFENVEFRRSFSVPQAIDVGKIGAKLKDGVLKLHLPKSEAAKPKQIEIKAA